MAAFRYKQSKNANQGRSLVAYVITDATVLSIGEAVKLASGKLVTAGAGGNFLGVVESFKKADGSPITDNGDGSDYSGTYTAPTSNTVLAMVDVSKDSKYSVTADAALATTTGSGLAGYRMDMVAGSNQLDESTSTTGAAQWFSWGEDTDMAAPDNSVIVSIFESESV